MRSTTLLLGVLGLLTALTAATDVKSCPPAKKDAQIAKSCFSQLKLEVEGFSICTAICSRLDLKKPYTPGNPENADDTLGAVFSVEAYNEAQKECGSHEAVAKALEDTCGCFADEYWKTEKCKIILGKPAGTGAVTSTAFPVESTKEVEPVVSATAEESTETVEATGVEGVETSTRAGYAQMSTSALTSTGEVETEAAEPTASDVVTRNGYITTTATQKEEEKATSTKDESPEFTEVSTDDASMTATKGYQGNASTTSATEETQETKKATTTSSMVDEKPEYLGGETAGEIEQKTTSIVKPMTTTSMADEKPEYLTEEATEETQEATSTVKPIKNTSTVDEKPRYPTEEATTETEEKTTSSVKPMTTTSMMDEKPKYLTEEPTSTMITTSKHTTTSHSEIGETSASRAYTEIEETSTEHEYAAPSHTKVPYHVASSSIEAEKESTTTMHPTTTANRGYHNEDTSSKEHPSHYHTISLQPNTTSSKPAIKTYSQETSMVEEETTTTTTTGAPRGYTTAPSATYDKQETSTVEESATKTPVKYSTVEESTKVPVAYTTEEEPTKTPMAYTTAEESTKTPVAYTTAEESTKVPVAYTTAEESTKTPVAYTTAEESTKTPVKYSTLEESTKVPVAYTTAEESTKVPVAYTTAEESTKTPMAYTTAEESTKTPVKYDTMEESSTAYEEPTKPPMAYTSAMETKTAMPYQTTAEAVTSKAHPTTTKPSEIVMTMDLCSQPTGASDMDDGPEDYNAPVGTDHECLSEVSDYSKELLCQEAVSTISNRGKWGQLNPEPLKAYKEGYKACGDKLPYALKKICNCIDPKYTGLVPTDKPTNLVPETLPPVCSVKPCPNKDKALPKNCLQHIEDYPLKNKQALCGMLCNKKEGGVDLEHSSMIYYWTFHDRCGSHESLVTALTQSCGCIMEDFDNGKTCVYPRTGPKEDTRSLTSETVVMKSTTSAIHTSMPAPYTAIPVYTAPEPYTAQPSMTSTSAEPPKKTDLVVEECPKDYEGKSEWPAGNCLDEVFGTKEGLAVADMICNYQCADFQQVEWPAAQMESYKKAMMKCKSPMEVTKALAKGCGCLNNGWVGDCRPQCHPPPGYTSTAVMMSQTTMQPMTTVTSMAPPVKDTTMTAQWTTTTYVTQPCNECQVTTITTVVPCSTEKTSTTSTSMMTTSTTEITMAPAYSTTFTPSTTTWAPETPIPLTTAPSTPPSISWSTITFTTTKCGGCPETTVITTVPCPQTLSKLKTDGSNVDLCTTHNQIPHCTVPPGKLEGKSYNTNCNQWYLIKEGDTCQGVADRIALEMDLLKAWNGMQPTDNCTCSPGRWLCVSLLDGGKGKNESVRYAKGRPTYSDYGPEATDYDNLPKPSPRPYLTEPIPTVQLVEPTPAAY
ncbi:hypothetical protein TWF506_005798 [Arthrobotrys conoides]|uniref:LysM domain-containing protein n=1 Tax=Arthrobotrys conoides TaxID=74498 RepID=A0AAN8PQ55_9PEZI